MLRGKTNDDMLEAPAQAAVGAGGRRGAGEQAFTEALVFGAVPYLAEAVLRGVAEGEAAVALHAEGRDAAGQNAAIGGDVHQRPGTAAERPWAVGALHFDGLAGVDGAGGREHDAELLRDGFGFVDEGLFALGGVLEEGGFGAGEGVFAHGVFEEDEALEVDLGDADGVGEADEVGELVDGFAEAGEPEGDARFGGVEFALHGGEVFYVGNDLGEEVLAANHLEDFGFGGVEGDAKLVEAGFDEGAAVGFGEEGSVGVEEDVDVAGFEIVDALGEVFDEHGLADAVEDDAGDVRILVDERGEELPGHVGFGLELLVGARAGGAEEIAAVGGLEVEADGFVLGDGVQLLFGLLEVAAHAVLFFFGLLCGGAELVCFVEEIFGRKDGEKCAHRGSLAGAVLDEQSAMEWASG